MGVARMVEEKQELELGDELLEGSFRSLVVCGMRE